MKKCFLYVDDVLWVFRDIAEKKPKSIFENPYMKMLKEAHDKFGARVQLNVFFRTDFFYSSYEFSLSDMPDCYKEEWAEAADWLKFGFHSKQEFPDYPYVNAKYEDVLKDIGELRHEVERFASKENLALGIVPHWNTMSKAGMKALHDSGIKFIHATAGETVDTNGDLSFLPYGHSARYLNNLQPETKFFHRGDRNKAVDHSICGYNHIDKKKEDSGYKNTDVFLDEETGMYYKSLGNGPILNLYNLSELEEVYAPLMNDEYVSTGGHEQYFYEDYFAFQPEYAEKFLKAAEILTRNGYEFIVPEELV